MASIGVGQVAAAHAATADDDKGDSGLPGEPETARPPSRSEMMRSRRNVVAQGASQAKMKCFWKYQTNFYDFYHDVGRKRPYVQTFVAFLIVANFLCQAAQRQWDPNPEPDERKHKTLWIVLDYLFNVAFLIELLVNAYGSWMWPFLSQGWNLFDMFVVGIGVIDMTGVDYPPALKMVRLFRAFRVFRLFGRIESLRKVLGGIWLALPGVANALIMAVILMSIYAVLAVDLFWNIYKDECKQTPTGGEMLPGAENVQGAMTGRGNCYQDEYYSNFFSALYTLFQILTGESWSEAGVRPILHYYQYINRDDAMTIGVAVFFVSFILLNAFVILNVIVAALLDGMNAAVAEDASKEASLTEATKLEDSEPKPQYVKDLEHSMRALSKEVVDLKGKIDILLQMQQATKVPGAVE